MHSLRMATLFIVSLMPLLVRVKPCRSCVPPSLAVEIMDAVLPSLFPIRRQA